MRELEVVAVTLRLQVSYALKTRNVALHLRVADLTTQTFAVNVRIMNMPTIEETFAAAVASRDIPGAVIAASSTDGEYHSTSDRYTTLTKFRLVQIHQRSWR